MPLYNFVCQEPECNDKGLVQEMLVGSEEQPECDHCMSKLKKLVSAPALFKFKGAGFYKPTHVKDPMTTNFEKC